MSIWNKDVTQTLIQDVTQTQIQDVTQTQIQDVTQTQIKNCIIIISYQSNMLFQVYKKSMNINANNTMKCVSFSNICYQLWTRNYDIGVHVTSSVFNPIYFFLVLIY